MQVSATFGPLLFVVLASTSCREGVRPAVESKTIGSHAANKGDDCEERVSMNKPKLSLVAVDAIVQRLEEAGAKVVFAPKSSPWGRRAVVEDPDGHRVELTDLSW